MEPSEPSSSLTNIHRTRLGDFRRQGYARYVTVLRAIIESALLSWMATLSCAVIWSLLSDCTVESGRSDTLDCTLVRVSNALPVHFSHSRHSGEHPYGYIVEHEQIRHNYVLCLAYPPSQSPFFCNGVAFF
jgi:hypothetical protein